MPEEIERVAYSIADAVTASGLSRSFIYALISKGDLPLVKVGKRSLIAADDLRQLILRHRVTS